MYLRALDAKDWFLSYKTCEDIFEDADGEDGEPVITQSEIDRGIADGMDEDLINQEFWCD
jgi:hypothetical protein